MSLPVEPALPALAAALRDHGCAVLHAPPGAGKTTRVPLRLLDEGWPGRIVLLEPRRVAARAAAERLAEALGEPVGRSVGYRIRGESVPGARIEVVTEGVLTRMLQSDPELAGVACVIFDEFHERALQADLGLALAIEVRGALRPDLRLLVMSATLDVGPVAALLGGAPVVAAEGRAFPVETIWLDRPWSRPGPGGPRFEAASADLVRAALAEAEGGVLVFLPGQAEIARVAAALAPGLPADVALQPLHGGLPFARQRAALAPLPGRRRLVLATAIAETSLTIPDIRAVVDAGRARRARFDPGSGMSRLVTERVTRAEAEQRRGRAGRVAPGRCYRMWTRGEEGALAAFPPPEIAAADLAGLALELALWGARDAAGLAFLTPPPAPALAEARALLADLGALDALDGAPGGGGAITAHGRRLAALPLHPRLGHMLLTAADHGAGALAADLAALLQARDPVRGAAGRAPADVALRLAALADPARAEAERPVTVDRAGVDVIRAEARRLRPLARRTPSPAAAAARDLAGASPPGPLPGASRDPGLPPASASAAPDPHGGSPGPAPAASPGPGLSPGAALSLAYPDRIGRRRPGEAPRFLLSGGKGAALPETDPLAGAPFLVAADLDGDPREAAIRLAAPLTEAEIRALHADRLRRETTCAWSRRDRAVRARERLTLGAVALEDRPWTAPPEAIAAAVAEGVRDLGPDALPWTPALRRLAARVEWLRAQSEPLPDFSDAGLTADLDDWLAPFLAGITRAGQFDRIPLGAALDARLGRDSRLRLDRLAPPEIVAPTGTRLPVDYAGAAPSVAVRLQEMFGLTVHPTVGPARTPLVLELLSPAQRPVQTTADLPGFWASSYADVRRELRGRYPRHPWPEDPAAAAPTRRAKPRGT
ncbi:ATP-dependent helicase HrpB [Amaricoccus sp.]|uniref:ATP-dependent helicase HrpB n=1 Tax=Amaricoccus sp. TaxID=1872485 RepID=UPI001B548C82|nr:ATP-dependent helicase HrpB [Amaricoccus sp.]MBP7003654.1 ATP-dependent helicase HrpB [Amaricoccus sp.]